MKRVILSLLIALAPMAQADEHSARSPLAADQWQMGISILRKGTEQPNKVLSPYSIHSALTLVRMGAQGDTAAEIDRALGSATPLTSRLKSYEELQSSVVRSEKETSVVIANSVFLSNTSPIKPIYINDARRFFSAEPSTVDFAAPEAARDTINSWVSQRTNSLIPHLIPAGEITKDTTAVLVNALYFKAPWGNPFSESATKKEDFWVSPKHTTRVAMMSQSDDYGYYEDSSWQGVRIAYRGFQYQMVVLLPKKKVASHELRETISTEIFTNVLTSSRLTKVNLSLPKFTVRESQPLRSTLEQLGMRIAFSDRADFSGMSTVPLQISSAQHEAVVTVDENGTEAAAATAFGLAARAFKQEQPKDVRVDHPYAFALIHTPSGAPLFVGVVGDPSI